MKNDIFCHKFIVFCEDHYNPLNIIRSLGEKGIRPIVILVGDSPCMVNHCKYLGELHIVRSREEGFDIILSKYGKEKDKPFILCCDDKTVYILDQHYDDLKNKFILYNSNEQGRLIWLQNKDNITNLAMEVGLDCPKKEVVSTGTLPQTLKYPIMTKVLSSTMGAWKNDVYICQNEQELCDAYKEIESPKLILQEYIHKKGEFCVEGFSINNGEDVFLPFIIDYIRFYHDSYGHYMTVKPFENEKLKRKIKAIIKKARFNGIFEAEFMKGSNDEILFLEINFRTSTWTYAATVGGVNFPFFWAKSMLSGKIPYDEMDYTKEGFTAMAEPMDFFSNVVHGKNVGFVKWTKELMGCRCLYYYNKHDKKPFFSYIYSVIRTGIKSRI